MTGCNCDYARRVVKGALKPQVVRPRMSLMGSRQVVKRSKTDGGWCAEGRAADVASSRAGGTSTPTVRREGRAGHRGSVRGACRLGRTSRRSELAHWPLPDWLVSKCTTLLHTGHHFAPVSEASTHELMGRMGYVRVDAALVHQHATAAWDRAIADSLDRMLAPGAATQMASGPVGGTTTN